MNEKIFFDPQLSERLWEKKVFGKTNRMDSPDRFTLENPFRQTKKSPHLIGKVMSHHSYQMSLRSIKGLSKLIEMKQRDTSRLWDVSAHPNGCHELQSGIGKGFPN